eukprot:2533216-Rhodomonas_salina.1
MRGTMCRGMFGTATVCAVQGQGALCRMSGEERAREGGEGAGADGREARGGAGGAGRAVAEARASRESQVTAAYGAAVCGAERGSGVRCAVLREGVAGAGTRPPRRQRLLPHGCWQSRR